MRRRPLPVVSQENGLRMGDGGEGHSPPILIESDDWYQWLADEQNHSFTFQYAMGMFTARRERKGSGWYWYAYRKRQGKLHKAYLGKPQQITQQRLIAAAMVFASLDSDGKRLNANTIVEDTQPLQQRLSTLDFRSEDELSAQRTNSLSNTATVLPAYLTALLCREQEVQSVSSLLQRTEVRLVTLTGPGGVGKTRLGVQVATQVTEHFRDGAFFIPLASLRDPEIVVPTIAHVLGLRDTGNWSLWERLNAYLRTRQVLLLLDNFEHLLQATPRLLELLTSCTEVKMLVTSRAVLRVRGEHEFHVLPLALPDLKQLPEHDSLLGYAAIKLFLQCACMHQPHFQLTPLNTHTIAEICVKLDGLPLALELAAARIKLLSPQELLKRLEQQLQFLTSGASDAPERQQTMRNTIHWSYELLSAAEQCVFRRISVFVAGFTVKAVEYLYQALGASASNVLDDLTSLLDKSLLQQREQGDIEPRLIQLETIREYGCEVLAASGEAEATQRAHASYYLALTEEVESRLTSTEKGRWLERLQQEHENLRKAFSWLLLHKEREAALRIGSALWRFWLVSGYLREGRTELARALAGGREGVAPSVYAKVLHAAAQLACRQGDFEQAEALCGESLALFRVLGDPRGSATCLQLLGYVSMQRSDYMVARSVLEEAETLREETGDKDDLAWRLLRLAAVLMYQGEYERAHTLLKDAEMFSREGGDSWSMVNSLYLLAIVMLYQDDLPRAHTLAEECLDLSRQEGYKVGIAYALKTLGLVALQRGDLVIASSLLQESLAWFKEMSDRENAPQSLVGLAWVSFGQCNYATARALFDESLALFKAVGNKWYIATCLVGLAAIATAQGELIWAVRLSAAAEALCQAIKGVLPPSIRAKQEFTTAATRTQLGEEVFVAAWTQGQSMTIEQVLSARGPVLALLIVEESVSPIPTPQSNHFPDELTAREVEVLRLVAQGLTDAQVAEKLVISTRTVSSHLQSIYRKIQVSSRSAATRYTIEHQLQ